ncbi:SlyX family protein [Aquicoccus sp. G2-2]|uniref:SlyX family protein n=1 Tax=Aquicoccus sp. G2-2 TaxID=3092120 RepID=UPI002AE006AC|nr:SlyX family protein [Aquicoccus sp. G2-2]MEA1112539.1 SlyX family protein [Aquicoccus sp. G2-2]
MEQLEEKIAYLERVVDDLSTIVARQEGEIARLTRRMGMLMRREAEREADAGSHLFTGQDRPPPHY